MFVIRGSLLDPTTDQSNALCTEPFSRALRGHALVVVCGRNAPEQLAFAGFARNDGANSAFECCEGPRTSIETQAALAVRLVAAVTRKTVLRKQRTNFAIELDVAGKRT